MFEHRTCESPRENAMPNVGVKHPFINHGPGLERGDRCSARDPRDSFRMLLRNMLLLDVDA